MKLYKNLTLMVLFGMILFGMASAAYATPIDPGVILHGDGKSAPIVGLIFDGAFPTPTGSLFNCPTDGSDFNCFQNANTFKFIAIHLFFTSPETSLVFSCGNNSGDPFFTSCSSSGNEVTFSGLGEGWDYWDENNGCDGSCQGIPGGGVLSHFEIGIVGLPTGDTASFRGVADAPAGTTPEPASVLLFVIAIGAIALFLKRA
jgi:hypothetical protein